MKLFQNERGFTLVEVMCVVAILGLVSVSSYGIFVGASTSMKKSETQLDANTVAQAVMEDLLARDDVDSLSDIPDYDSIYGYNIEVNIEQAHNDLQTQYNDTIVDAITPEPYQTENPGSTPNPGSTDAPQYPTHFPTVPPNYPDYNAKIEIFDYCDFDLYDVIKAGLVMIYGDYDEEIFTSEDKFNECMNEVQSLSSAPASFKYYSAAQSKLASNGIDSSQYQWIKPCYDNLEFNDVKYNLAYVMNQYKTNLNRCENALFNVGSFGPSSGHTADELKTAIEEFLQSTPHNCNHVHRGYTCDYNVFENIEYLYDTYIETQPNAWGGIDTVLNDDFKDTDLYELIDPNWGLSNFKTAIVNCHNYINTNEFNTGTKTGPYLLLKMYNKDGELLPLSTGSNVYFVTPTARGSNNQDIYFQLYPRYLYFQKGGVAFYTYPGQNVLDLETEDLKQPGGWYQTDIYKNMTFMVIGGLTYRQVFFGFDAPGGGFLDLDGDGLPEKIDEDGNMVDFLPNLNFVQSLSYNYVPESLLEDGINSLFKFTDFSNPSYVSVNGDFSDDPTETLPPTSGPTGGPGSTGDPGNEGGYTQGDSGHSIPGQYSLMLKYTVTVYEADDTEEEKELATLVSFNLGSATFDFSEPTPEPTPTPQPIPNIELIFDDTSDTVIKLASGAEATVPRSEIANAEFIITGDDGSFTTNNMGGLSSDTPGLAILRDADDNIKTVVLTVSGELSTDIMEIRISCDPAVSDCSTRYIFIDNTTGSGSMTFTDNTDGIAITIN